jgi:cytochrome c-type biogenesis protein CcsB
MDKKIISFLGSIFFSTRLMSLLFISFSVAMAAGTFIESKYNTDTARIMIYNSWWFEAIMFFFVVNFIGNIKRYQLWKKEKWATLILHMSFIFILVGAFVTRYVSHEGMMPIREGETANEFFSDKTYITVLVDGKYKGEMKRKTHEKLLILSPATNNNFSIGGAFDETDYEIEYQNFVMGATEKIVADKNGIQYLKMVESGGGERHDHYLKSGEVANFHNVLFALNKFTQGAININTEGKVLTIQAPFAGDFMRMSDQMKGKVAINTVQPLMLRSLYNLGGTQFVFPDPPMNGKVDYVSNNDYKDKTTDDALILKVSAGNEEKVVTLLGSKGKMGVPQTVKVGELEVTLLFGSKIYNTPFDVKLNDFIAKKYPGTEKSYSSFESKVEVSNETEKFDYEIYMNHILDYKGYRLFQASFDEDEKGTILSVSHDFWGTWITYIGYFLLYFAMMAILFTKYSRFADLKRKLEKVKMKKAKLTVIALFLSLGGFAQNHQQAPVNLQVIDSLIQKYKVTEEHAERFGKLVIQDVGGRMKPVNTFASELLRKVSHENSYKGLNADQVFLSMTQLPSAWYQVQMVYMSTGNDSIRKIIGIPAKQKLASFIDFFDDKGNYKLSKYLDAAYKTPNPTKFEKDFVETDKKVNLLSSALFGSILKIFPIPNNANNKWVSYPELGESNIKGMDSTFTKQIIPIYLASLANATENNNYKEANFYLDGVQKYQRKYGEKVIPSEKKITSEIFYNKINIFKNLFYLYMFGGILMIILVVGKIFNEKNKILNYLVNGMHIFIAILFVAHTAGLILRWFISGHAPWSNAYESIIYVAWATMFFGLAFDIKSKLTVASSSFVTSMILMAAYANWIDPEIATLQPVLDSYWLMIHVAVIVASYGPFALGMILGLVSLVLILFTTQKNQVRMELNIREITYINEMALTIGLILLTIGNFLGGQWANESWGRYWGWDPKETWALISIMVYAFVIHMRYVPGLRGKWVFNFMAMLAFISILFTYYGVNFHLVGLHSYASGEAKSLNWIWQSILGISILGAISYPKYRKYYKNK